MPLIDLLLQDFDNKRFQRMNQISEELENHISGNVVAMQEVKMDIILKTIDQSFSEKDMPNGWVSDGGLYEKLLIRYSEITQKPLIRWI